jgi:DNA-binding CsgD family transcriptional regulator
VRTEIVGREAALGEIDRFVARVADQPAGLVLLGEPGIGKSTAWTEAIERLVDAGCLVLQSHPAEAEVRFAFAGLRDVLSHLSDRIDSLPPPMARALRVALLLEEPAGGEVEGGTVEAAALALLRDVASDRPVVVAIDDVQWLDEPSRVAFAYVARRARDARISFILAERLEGGRSVSRWLSQGLGEKAVVDIALPPLSVGALHHLLRSRLGVALSRPRLVRVHELSGGNPYYALEIAASGEAAQGDRAVLPRTLRELVARRLESLPAFTRRLLLAAALASGEGVGAERLGAVFEEATATVRRGLEPAVAAGVLGRVGEPIRFSHPLLAAAAIDEAAPDDVARVHERLAETATSPEARARHLSAARSAPDSEVALALDEAAALASARGAATDSAELRALAVRFSEPVDPLLPRRLVAEGESLFIAGDLTGARRVLASHLDDLADRDLRVSALLLLATMTWYDGSTEEAVPIGTRALAEAADDPTLLARVHARMAWLCDNDLVRAQGHAAAALARIDPAVDPALYAFALLNDAYLRLLLGIAADRAAVDRGWELQEQARIWEFSTLAGNWPKLVDDFGTARARLRTYLERVREQGDESSIAQLAGYLAELECWTGNLDRARAYADEAIEVAEETGQRSYLVQGLRHRAMASVMSGVGGVPADDAERALVLAEELGDPAVLAGAQATRAFIALTDGDPATVDRLCTAATASLDRIGMRDHAPYRYQADHIEALVALGDDARATALLERHAARGSLGPRPWILATAARCDALLRSARGDAAGAAQSIAQAIEHHARLEMPFEHARTLLVQGQVARRANRRRDAVTALNGALAEFERLGSTAWAERTRAELARVPIRRGRREDLTPTELDVARLAARGRTNREVASELYISTKTVEANLSRAYAKLGIRSRAELGAVMADRSDEASA